MRKIVCVVLLGALICFTGCSHKHKMTEEQSFKDDVHLK